MAGRRTEFDTDQAFALQATPFLSYQAAGRGKVLLKGREISKDANLVIYHGIKNAGVPTMPVCWGMGKVTQSTAVSKHG